MLCDFRHNKKKKYSHKLSQIKGKRTTQDMNTGRQCAFGDYLWRPAATPALRCKFIKAESSFCLLVEWMYSVSLFQLIVSGSLPLSTSVSHNITKDGNTEYHIIIVHKINTHFVDDRVSKNLNQSFLINVYRQTCFKRSF